MRRLWIVFVFAATLLTSSLGLPLTAQDGAPRRPLLAGPVDFVRDTFTDTDSTLLSSHTGEAGATWTLHTLTTGTIIILTNRAHKDNTTNAALYYASGLPASTNYTLEAIQEDQVAEGKTSRACGWIDTATITMVCVGRINSTTVELGKFINGTFTQIDTEAVTHTLNMLRGLKVTRTGTSYEWFLDNGGGFVSLGSFTISDSELSAAGRCGMRMTSNWSTNSNYPITSIRCYQ